MPFEKDIQPITGARGPNSAFGPNQIVNVPGIGPVKLSDYGPSVRGIDIPVTSRSAMMGNAVNRVVNINGQRVQLSGYMPKQYDPRNLDPTGGGSLDAYGKPIIPYTGQQAPVTQSPGSVTDAIPSSFQQPPVSGSSAGNVTDNPFVGGIPTSVPDNVQQIEPLDIPFSGPLGNEPTTAPYQYQPGGNVPTNEFMMPTGPVNWWQQQQTSSFSEPTPSFSPPPATSESMLPTGPNDYLPAQGANTPTYEGMLPTGPADYLPSQGANVPTNEEMLPTGPADYRQSSANIPTDESMVADLAPDAYQPATPEEPQPTSFYPDGQGGYVQLDENGNPVSQAPVNGSGPMSPYDPNFEYGAGAPTTPSYGGPVPGWGINPFVGGAFWTPAGGISLPGLGQGSGGDLGTFGTWGSLQNLQALQNGPLNYGSHFIQPFKQFAQAQGGDWNPLPPSAMLPKSQWSGGPGQSSGAGQSFSGAAGPTTTAQ